MCEPTTIMMISMAVMATAAAGSSIIANKAANKQAEAEAEAAHTTATYDYQQLAEKGSEVDEQAAQDKLQRQLQTARERGRISVAMGEAGVGGNSAMRVMSNAVMQGSYDTSVIEANRTSKIRQINSEMFGVHARAKGRVKIAKSKSVSRGTAIMQTGIAAVGGAAQGYSFGKSFGGKTMTKKPTSKVN